MTTFIVYFEHAEYGYYTTQIQAPSIDEALSTFIKEWAYKDVYGIMKSH